MADLQMEAKWLDGGFDDAADQATFAEITLEVAQQPVSAIYQPETDTTFDGPRLPAIILAEGLVRRWWALLHEPQRTLERRPRDAAFEARHRLDALTSGYVFPPLGLWSGGDTIQARMFNPDSRFHTQRFAFLPREAWSLQRGNVEEELGRFISTVIERATTNNCSADELKRGWDAIKESTYDSELRDWCVNAGRLGLDPFDSSTPDIDAYAAGLSESLFADICEASELPELQKTCYWARSAIARLQSAKPVSMQGYGAPPLRDLHLPGFKHGYDSVDMLRGRLGLPLDPKIAVDRVLDGADAEQEIRLDESTPAALEGVVRRRNKLEFQAAVPSRSLRQRRFRMCRATYLAWRAGSETDVAATPAETWRQQASRSFAAELLAPRKLLKERFGKSGLNMHSADRLASEWMCPPQTIVHQAQNNGIEVRGAETAAYF